MDKAIGGGCVDTIREVLLVLRVDTGTIVVECTTGFCDTTAPDVLSLDCIVLALEGLDTGKVAFFSTGTTLSFAVIVLVDTAAAYLVGTRVDAIVDVLFQDLLIDTAVGETFGP